MQSDHLLVPIPDSAERWRAWLAGRAEAFFLYARQQSRNEADARDVLQEALVESWRRAGGEPPDDALVFTTIRRRAIDLARSDERRRRRENGAAEREELFAVDFTEGDTRQQLAVAVGELPEHLREVLVLRIWGGLEFAEIAKVAGIPVNTASSRHRYALEQLREKLSSKLK